MSWNLAQSNKRTAVSRSKTQVPFVHRPPTQKEFEKFRLILSTYQDGTGMLAADGNSTLPGWRDFERSFALAINGIAAEDKGIYDVHIPDPNRKDVYFGASCKMRGTLRQARAKGIVTIEVSNAAGEFWDALKDAGLDENNYSNKPKRSGEILIELVESWHEDVGLTTGGNVDNDRSFYLTLQWEKSSGSYQLFQYAIDMPDPSKLSWSVSGRRLSAKRNDDVLFEWYGHSGGQLKYYPTTKEAIWQTDEFKLEPIPDGFEIGIMSKAATYFPEKWKRAS